MSYWHDCECGDIGCPVHRGVNHCFRDGLYVLYRSDMADATGTAFCDDCSDDAMESGLYGSGYFIHSNGRREWILGQPVQA